MKQEKIQYHEIMNLKFKEEFASDSVYFNEYGFEYCIITKALTKKIYIQWAKETQLCDMVRIDKDGNVKSKMQIKDFTHLKEIIDFFSDEVEKSDSTIYNAC